MAGMALTSGAGFGYKKKPNPIEQQYKVHNAAVNQQAGDYDNIMKGYKDLHNSPLTDKYQSIFDDMSRGGEAKFQDTAHSRRSLSNLGELSRTGGLSEGDQSNLRARGVSPIRAAYGNANRNINRQRGLAGGYSPNYNAVASKMAREQSGMMADKMTDVNAGIAEMVQRGRLSAAPQYAAAAGSERGERNEMEMFNKRDLPEMRTGVLDRIGGMKSGALEGMRSLYGTTPALSSLYGGQALQGAQFQNQVKHQNRGSGMQLMSSLYGGRG